MDLWNYNVSSEFNYIKDIIAGIRPFATWHSFTVLEYLLAVTFVSFGVVLCFSLAAFIVGATIRNSYMGFLVIFIGTMFLVFLPMILPNHNLFKFAFVYSPIWLSLKLPVWFTDGGMDILWRNFEIWGLSISFLILSLGLVLATYRFERRDIT
jgi:hypothetical protein